MDPSPGRDGNSNSSPSEPENPFIRFKNFADSQVSSLLQGIIGLPSAISRRSSEDNQWAGVDEDLRRRDELQAKQRAFESQWREVVGKAAQTSESESPRQKLVNGKETPNGEINYSPKTVQDLPLYSPVTRELFDNFRPEDALLTSLFSSSSRFGKYEFGLPPFTLDPLGIIKDLSLTALKTSPVFHSEYSLLPYLLFSPYSPIKLEMDAGGMSVNRRSNKIRYCAAFEDLIRTSQGRESSTQSHRNAERSNSLFAIIPGEKHWFWMQFLARDGILQQKRQDSDQTPDFKAWRAMNSIPGGSDLDMFEHVQRTSQSQTPSSRSEHPSDDEMKALRNFQLEAAMELEEIAREKTSTKEDAEAIRAAMGQKNAKGVTPTDKVVATSTTTERTRHEDGAVETKLTIWKQFEDGRESTTTTHHVDEPACSGRELGWSDERTHQEEEKGRGENEKDEKKEKKGWFWN